MKELTLKQCSHIAGGDHVTSLADDGGVGGFSSTDMALAGMGVGYYGGPMAVVTIGLPAQLPLGDFDKFLIGSVSGAAGGFTIAALQYAAIGVVGAAVIGPTAIAIAGVAVAGAVGYGATRLLQYANNEGAYAGHVRQLSH